MSKDLCIGLAGLGTVGAGVVQLLASHGERLSLRTGRKLVLSAVSARDKKRERGLNLGSARWYDDAVVMAKAPDIDVIVELIGGDKGVAKNLVEAAIQSGKHVVTANKALIARHGTALAAAAEKADVALNFEGAVAGGIPIIKSLRESFGGNGISSVHGILNGTCNYILTQMEETGAAFADVLKEAQALGYAEADPAFDVEGTDTAHKLAILTSLAFGVEPDIDHVYTEGIRRISALDIEFARLFGYRIKLLGVARPVRSGIAQRVHPCMVPLSAAIADVSGVYNAVLTEGDFVGRSLLEGRGAGAGPTASAVMSDILDIAQGLRAPAFGIPAHKLKKLKPAPMDELKCAYYLRFSVADRPGVLAHIASALAEEKVSIQSMVQRGQGGQSAPVYVVMITHETKEAAINRALKGMAGKGGVIEAPLLIRIEEFKPKADA